MLVVNSVKSKDHDWMKFISQNCIKYEFFEANYLKCPINFATDCRLGCRFKANCPLVGPRPVGE